MKINQDLLAYQTVFNARVPKRGPRCIPINLDFGTIGPDIDYSLDYQNMESRGFMEMVQSVFVDNANNATEFIITCSISRQSLRIPPYSQAYLAILMPNPPRMVFTSESGGVVQVVLLNFPVINHVWSVQV